MAEIPFPEGAGVFAGDRVRIKFTLTGKDPAQGMFVEVPYPADCDVTWREGQMTAGSNLAFETATQRLDTVVGKGGPGEVVVLVDKVSQTGPGQVRVQVDVQRRKPDGTHDIFIVKEFRMNTMPGARPTGPTQPSPTPILPTGGTFSATLVTPTPLK